MFLYLLLLLTLVPIVELVLLFRIAGAIDWIPTIGLVLVTGVVGASLARHQGIKTLSQIQADLSAGKMPASAMVEGVLILAAGLVLVTPGVLTDAFGLLLLVPRCRRWIGRKLSEQLRKYVVVMHNGDGFGTSAPGDGFIDVEATDVQTQSHGSGLDRLGNDAGDGGKA